MVLWCLIHIYQIYSRAFYRGFPSNLHSLQKIRISLASNTNSLCKIYTEPSSIVFYASLRFSSIIFTFFGHCLFPCFQLGIFFQIFFRNMSPSIFSNLQRYICRILCWVTCRLLFVCYKTKFQHQFGERRKKN